MRLKFIKLLSYVVMLALLLISLCHAYPDVTTKSPTAHTGSWSSGENAYSSNNLYASSSTANALHTYWQYGFWLVNGYTIDKVEVGIEAYAVGDDDIGIKVSWDTGVTWSTEQVYSTIPTSDPNTCAWFDFTSATVWDGDKLNDTNFRVQIRYVKVGAKADLLYLDWIPARVTYTFGDVTPPTVTIYKPENVTYSTSTIPVNFTASDSSGISKMWFNCKNATSWIYLSNQSYSVPTSMTNFVNGTSYQFYAFANDTYGNVGSNSIWFSVSIPVQTESPQQQPVVPERPKRYLWYEQPLTFTVVVLLSVFTFVVFWELKNIFR